MLVVFDIDGTIANIEHRLDYVRSKPKNWKAFDAGIPNDKVNPYVAAAFFALRDAGHDIVFASGRNERSRDATVAWLDANGFWQPSSHLWMRKADDFRSDDIVKLEILDEIIADYGKKPDMVFDDRPRVIRAWRSQGIFVFNVYQGEEDF
jgi:phosphoglycolate phosphatase-like HAD superfamily hydrolase